MKQNNLSLKKQPVGFRLSLEAKRDIKSLADIWSISQQEIFERAICEFLSRSKKAVIAGRKLQQERMEKVNEL